MAKLKASAKGSMPLKSEVRLVTRIPGVRGVSITGDFSSWSDSGIEMTNGREDLWEVNLALPPGRYEYRLRVDGEWHDHPEAAARVPNPFGTKNCVLTMS